MHHLTKLFLAIVSTISLAGCSVKFSSEEYDKGIKDVATYFGGNCNYSKNVDYETGSGKTETIKIEINNSNVALGLIDKPGLSASHAAYIFYNDLIKDKKTVDLIKVTINYSDGSTTINQYPITKLDSAKRFLSVVNAVISAMKNHNYDSIGGMFNIGINPEDKMHVLQVMERSDSLSGAIKKYQMDGFTILYKDYGTEMVYHGVVQREKHDYTLALGIVPDAKNGIICNISYSH